MSKEIYKYDEYDNNGNLIYFKHFDGNEYLYKYDKNNNHIYTKGSDGFEYWGEYDENNNEIHFKNTDGLENWAKYNNENNRIIITKQEFENIKIREYNSRTKCSRFEIMDI